jgi:hypothetical protein
MLSPEFGWVFPYWWEFGRFYKKEEGIYVPDNELVRLALITFEERRATNLDFDLFMDVRKYGWQGVFRMNNEKCEAIIMNGETEKQARRKKDKETIPRG